jgi:hypothetical protein
MSGVDQRVVLAPADGSLGPLLRLADDRLPPRTGYGRHSHAAVDVVAVVLRGSLRHGWGEGAVLAAGDVAVLRAGAGLDHDETAGDDGARVLQCYLRSTDPGAPPAHEVHRAVSGWLPLNRPDARLWLAQPAPGDTVEVPPGLLLVAGEDGVAVVEPPVSSFRADDAVTLLAWQVDATRPSWAED